MLVTFNIGSIVYEKIKLQNAVDSAAITAAVWQARGLNVISDLNYVLLAATGGDILRGIVSGTVDMTLVRSIQKAQLAAQTSFAGASALAAYKIFKENDDNAECLPLPLGLRDFKMFSLRVRREYFGGIPLHMVKDTPDYWEDQSRDGPFIRLIATKKTPSLFWGKIIKFDKSIIAVSQACAYNNNKNTSKILKYLGGGLWNPTFDAKLMSISVRIPGINGLILH